MYPFYLHIYGSGSTERASVFCLGDLMARNSRKWADATSSRANKHQSPTEITKRSQMFPYSASKGLPELNHRKVSLMMEKSTGAIKILHAMSQIEQYACPIIPASMKR